MANDTEIPSWKNTLYSRAINAPWWGHISKFAEVARTTGYPYFEWNDRVYRTADLEDTGLTVRNLR